MDAQLASACSTAGACRTDQVRVRQPISLERAANGAVGTATPALTGP
jgi:hypothetical protein